MWTQIIGKTRLALAPRENHWWHVPRAPVFSDTLRACLGEKGYRPVED